MTRFDDDLTGVVNPDFLAIGLGGTNMMAMLWSVAMGRRAVGVEMRGNPFLGVHWNIRADFYHQLGLIDQMMLERYGEEGVPKRLGKQLKLADLLFGKETVAGDIIADSIVDGFDTERHIVGTIHHIEFIDDRWRDGIPHRHVTLLQPPEPPTEPDPARIRTNVAEVLDGPSVFQGSASSVLILLRRYLERIEEMDMERGVEPRVRLFVTHRVVPAEGDGFIRQPDGRLGVRVEALQELDYNGRFVRVRAPGSETIDIGVPELFMIAEGFRSTDAERLGFQQEDVVVDHGDGRGPIVAQADFLAGLIEVLVGGRLRRRIASEFDEHGREYWVRQIAVGHENDPEVGWILVQVPDYKTFDPRAEGLVPPETDPKSPEYFAAYDQLLHSYYMEQISEILEMPAKELKGMQMVYGPKMFSLVERMGESARIAPNGVVAGDSFGNGHFLTSGGAMTGMVGHSSGVLSYWKDRDAGRSPEEAIVALAERIKDGTLGWLHVSATEYSDALPINFGAERIRQLTEASGAAGSVSKSHVIESSRRVRHSLLILNPSDWRRPLLRSGRVYSGMLPELHAVHPALRKRQRVRKATKVAVGFVAKEFTPQTVRLIDAVLGQPGVQMGLVSEDSFDKLTDRIRDRLVASCCVTSVSDADAVAGAFRAMEATLGRPALLLGTEEAVQVSLGQTRKLLGVPGTDAMTAMAFQDPVRLKDALLDAGVPATPYALVRNVEDGIGFAEAVGFYPLVLREMTDGRGWTSHRVETEEELFQLLVALAPSAERPMIGEEVIGGTECSLEVMCIGGVPAWASATRRSHSALQVRQEPVQWSILLPREADDPADAVVRRMGYAALRTLRMGDGIASVRWARRPDGTALITDVSSVPPSAHVFSLMALSHGADLYRAWANAVVNGVFGPIPRLSASGVVFLRGRGEGKAVASVEGWDELQRELGDMVVEAVIPTPGQASCDSPEGDGYVVLRHAETARVDEALQRIAAGVRVERGSL
ncbi:MAG: acetyl-CoA carboxylase biotin carboxylase subunit family protein [Gemmatimonadaceae bacterium]